MSNHCHQNSNYVYELVKGRRNDIKNIQYQKKKVLGKGGFATCYEAKRTFDQRTFAMKMIKLVDRRQKSLSRDNNRNSNHRGKLSTSEKAAQQARILKYCDHQNIVKYETDFVHQNDFYLVMQHCQKGSFGQMLKIRGTITQSQTRYYLVQMIHGLQYLRSKKIIHRDLKPANYLLTSSLKLKIADFGLATIATSNSGHYKNTCGTPNYISPQMLFKQDYSYEVDVWSIGVILYSMLYGIAPFETRNKDAKETYEKIKKCQYELRDPKVSQEARDLISKILLLDPKRRLTLEQILEHSFVENFQVPKQLLQKYHKEQPDQEFLDRHQTERKDKQSQSQQNQKSLMREKANRKQIQGSFSRSFDNRYSRSSQTKKERKQRKKENKCQQRKHPLPRGVAEVIRKIQSQHKQQVLTSSPISRNSNQSKKGSEKNKCIQYPSYSKTSNIQLIKIQSMPQRNVYTHEEHIKQNNKSQSQLSQAPIKDRIQLQQPHLNSQIQQIENSSEIYYKNSFNIHHLLLQPFPSSKAMMKPLDFQYMFIKDNDNKIQDQELQQYRIIDQKNQCQKVVLKEMSLLNAGKKGNGSSELPNNIYSVEDFVVFSKSSYENHHQNTKLVYCLKEQTQQNLNTGKKIIGVIFNDNSSIIIRVDQIQPDHLKDESIHVPYLSLVQDFPCLLKLTKTSTALESPCGSHIISSTSITNLPQNLFITSFVRKSQKLNQRQNQMKNQAYERLDFQIRLKINYAKDAFQHFMQRAKDKVVTPIKHNRFQIVQTEDREKGNQGKEKGNQGKEKGNQGKEKSNQGKEKSNQGKEKGNQGKEKGNQGKQKGNQGKQKGNQGKEKSNQGKENILNSQNENNFVFVKLFVNFNLQNKLYFELNDGSKHHLIRKKRRIANYQEWVDCNNHIVPQSKYYEYIIYNSSKIKGYIRDINMNFLQLNKTEMNTHDFDQMKEYNDRDKMIVKHGKTSRQPRSYINSQLLEGNLPKLQQSSSPKVQQLLAQLCQSFKNKMELHYIRYRQHLHSTSLLKKQINYNQVRSDTKIQQQVKQNSHVIKVPDKFKDQTQQVQKFVIKNGTLELLPQRKLKLSEYQLPIIVQRK